LSPVFKPFIKSSPISVMSRGMLERVLQPEQLDQWFDTTAKEQYTRDLMFSTLFDLMSQVVQGSQRSVHAAFQASTQDVGVSIASIYNKLQGIEPGTSAALVRYAAEQVEPIIRKLLGKQSSPLPGKRIKLLDGNCIEKSHHRIKELRAITAGPLPGKSLVVYDPLLHLPIDVFACEDGHAQERSLLSAVLETIEADDVWIAAQTSPDGYSGATWLAVIKETGMETVRTGISDVRGGITWWESFIGLEPGSMGETSALFCLIGAAILIVTGVGSWRIMLSALVGSALAITFFNVFIKGPGSPYAVPIHWHWVIAGFVFAIVFMATDPVSAPFTDKGRYIYGFSIGVLGIVIREVNPAYAGSWMLSILFMNMFSSTIDHYVVRANIKRRLARNAA